MADCKKVLTQARLVLLKEATSSSAAPSSKIAAAERARAWHQELENLAKQCKQPQLYVGVLGDTGMLTVCQQDIDHGQDRKAALHRSRACVSLSYHCM